MPAAVAAPPAHIPPPTNTMSALEAASEGMAGAPTFARTGPASDGTHSQAPAPFNPAMPAQSASALDNWNPADLDAARARDRGQQPAAPATPAQPAATQPTASPAAAAAAKADPLSWEKPKDKHKAADWDKLRDTYESQVKTLQQELETFRTGKALAEGDITKLPLDTLKKHPELAKIIAKHDEYFDIVKQVSVERDPEFVAKFEPRREAAIRAAKAVAGGAAEELGKLMAQPASDVRDDKIEALTENFSDSSKRRVAAALQNLAVIDVERDGEIAHRKANFESRQLDGFKQHEQQQRERTQVLDRAFNQTLAFWSDPKEGMPFFVKTGDPRWDAEVDATVATARDIFNGSLTPEQLADASKWAAVAKRVFSERDQLLTELQKFKEHDTRMRGTTPVDFGAGGSFVEAARPAGWSPTNPHADAHSFAEGLEAARARDYGR